MSRKRCAGIGQPAVSLESVTGDPMGWCSPVCPVCHQGLGPMNRRQKVDPDLPVYAEEPPGIRHTAVGVAIHEDGSVIVAALDGKWFDVDGAAVVLP